MGMLPNIRDERFAQNLASGMKQQDAYENAGWSRNAHNASRKRNSPEINARIEELLQERLKAQVIGSLALNRDWVTDKVRSVIERCMTAEAVVNKEGIPTGYYKFQPGHALKGLHLIGQSMGMWKEDQDIGRGNVDETLEDRLKRIIAGDKAEPREDHGEEPDEEASAPEDGEGLKLITQDLEDEPQEESA